MAKIKVIEYPEAEGRLREIYDDLKKQRGKLASVHKIQSLRPESIVRHMDLYMELMYSKSELSRAEREMVAVIVSVANCCQYCQLHHAEALNHYWRDDEKMEQLCSDYTKIELSPREMALCVFAEELTKNPGSFQDKDLVESLKSVGLTDSGILDVVLVTAYFNFVNRIVLSLEIEVEDDYGGFKYE